VLDDLDPERTGRDQLPSLKEGAKVVNDRTTNWTAVPCPTPAWARLVHPDLPEDEAYRKLVEQILHVCRLDEDDPIAAWKVRLDKLTEVREKLNARKLDAVRFAGPGTDLTVGLLPSSKWLSAGDFTTIDGIVHMPNLPSEEVFSCPDPTRTDGVVRSTKPLVVSGSIIRGLEVEFRDGRAVRIDADEGADVLRGYAARDEGASRLGEVALVDGEGRIGPLDTVFFDTLLDENAASHIALGEAYEFTAGEEDRDRLNTSGIHVDFMIGGDDVDVDGVTAAGERVPVLRGGAWQI
jgi:aminopeptidase